MSEIVTAEGLEKAGYRRFDQKGSTRAGEGGFVALWQKRIEDDLGTRYFVNFTEYDLTPFTGCHSFHADVQFNFTNGGFSNVTHSVNKQTIEDVEDYFNLIWETIGMGYYEGGPEYPEAGM
jgi:hypothetical protein